MQTEGIPDRRYYPPALHLRGSRPRPLPFWMEVKKQGGKPRKGQLEFRSLCENAREPYVIGGLKELAQYLRENRIAEVGIR
jgi:hypothetical protein